MAASFESGNGSGWDVLTHIMAEMWPNHRMATLFTNQKCGKIFKKPHKMTFAKIFCVDFTKFRVKSVETRVKNPHKTNFFFKNVENVESSIGYYCWYIRKVLVFHISTLFKNFWSIQLLKNILSLYLWKNIKNRLLIA